MRSTRNRIWVGQLVLFLLFSGSFPTWGQSSLDSINRCGSFERDQQLMRNDPGWRLRRERMDALLNEYVRTHRSLRSTAEEVIRIPVVVHVVHDQKDNTIGGLNNPNITVEQIRSQIEVLNEDYRRKPGTPGFNNNPLGADSHIEFYLAEYDPDGYFTDGITRHQYLAKSSFNPFSDADLLAEIAYWPTDKYLNIWVCRLSNSYLGIAQFPSVDRIPGLDTANEPNEKTDGVIIDFRYFGRKTGAITSKIYNLGRTTTHEVAHWLGLIHTWGDTDCGTDYIEDTPPTKEPNKVTVCQPKFSNCLGVTTRNMIENYLDYSPDSCMNIFTHDQVARMRAVLALSPRRASLVEYSKEGRLEPAEQLTVTVFPNPVESDLTLEVRFADYQSFGYSIYDLTGRMLYQAGFDSVWSRRIRLDVQLLPPGVYIVRVNTDRESVTQRFTVL